MSTQALTASMSLSSETGKVPEKQSGLATEAPGPPSGAVCKRHGPWVATCWGSRRMKCANCGHEAGVVDTLKGL